MTVFLLRWDSSAICLLSLVVVSCVTASCFNDRQIFLDYTGRAGCDFGGETFRIGETRVTNSCYNCTCDLHDGLFCCGMGMKSGRVDCPRNFRLRLDGGCGLSFERLPPDLIPQ